MIALDLKVETVRLTRHWLVRDPLDRQCREGQALRREHRFHRKATPVAREQLVLHRGMHERRDERM